MLPDTGYVRLKQILTVLPVSEATWFRWVAEGFAPKGVLLGPRVRAWRVEDIREFMGVANDKAA